MAGSRMAIFIIETEIDKDGQYIPCIAVEGEKGYHRTDWRWGKDLEKAKCLARESNAERGIDEMEAVLIQASTMSPLNVESSE